jgi:hypothetical protein
MEDELSSFSTSLHVLASYASLSRSLHQDIIVFVADKNSSVSQTTMEAMFTLLIENN